jgi:hypothetical protein
MRTAMTNAQALQTVSLHPGMRADVVDHDGRMRDWQKDFASALLNPAMPVPQGIVGPNRERDIKRFNVYRNNVFVGLIEALKAAFPAVCRIVGDEFFTAMARVYAALEPPASPVMLEYGATFPAFVEAFEPARSVPYLADVARLERAWVEAYHAAEFAPIALNELGAIDAARLPHVSFALHPSLRVVRSPFPVVTLWQMNVDGGVPAATDIFRGGEQALVIRPDAEVEVRQVTPGAAIFIERLARGATVAVAASAAQDAGPAFDLAQTLGNLFAVNAMVGWQIEGNHAASQFARNA